MQVSVIVPCFNHASVLARAVESALRQSGVVEVIVVDDASSDDSAEVAKSLYARDARVQLCSLARNGGPGVARNRGVALAKGDLIAFLDADDEFIGDFTSLALPLFKQNPALVVAKCEMEFFDPVKGYILPDEDPRHAAAVLSSSCGMLMIRSLFLRVGGFPEDPVFRGPAGGEDVAFMQAVMDHFQPIARIEHTGYRVSSCAGSHVDRFLALTRLTDTGSFEFVPGSALQTNADRLAAAVDRYLKIVAQSLSDSCRPDRR